MFRWITENHIALTFLLAFLVALFGGIWELLKWLKSRESKSTPDLDPKEPATDATEVIKIKNHTTPFMAPRDKSYFAGRDYELKQLFNILIKEENSVPCVIAGIGCIGKSALATRFATLYRDHFPGGVFWASIDSQTPRDVAQRIAITLSMTRGTSTVQKDQDAKAFFEAVFRGKRVLFILDNADGPDAYQKIQDILPGDTNVSVIITTRHISHYVELDAHIIELECFNTTESIEVFTNIHGPDYILKNRGFVEEFSAKVLGLPLAIAMKAQAIKSHKHILAHQSLEALANDNSLVNSNSEDLSQKVIESVLKPSLEFLDNEVINLLQILIACPKIGFSVETASNLSQKLNFKQVRDILYNLVDISLLLQLTENRFAFHPVIRVCLRKFWNPIHADRNHFEYWSKFASKYCADDVKDWEILSCEWEAIQLSWQTSITEWFKKKNHQIGLMTMKFGQNLRYFIDARGLWDEGIVFFAQCREIARELKDKNLEFILGRHLAIILRKQGQNEKAIEIHNENLQLARASKDRLREGMELEQLGRVYLRKHRFNEAALNFEEALSIAKNEGKAGMRYVAQCNNCLGRLHLRQGYPHYSTQCFETSLKIYSEIGDEQGRVSTLGHLGDTFYALGNIDSAITYFCTAINAAQKSGRLDLETANYVRLGKTLEVNSNPSVAVACFTIASELSGSITIRDQYIETPFEAKNRLENNLSEILSLEESQKRVDNFIKSWIFTSRADHSSKRKNTYTSNNITKTDNNLQSVLQDIINIAYPSCWPVSLISLPTGNPDFPHFNVICSDTERSEATDSKSLPRSRAPSVWYKWEALPGFGLWVRPKKYDPILRNRLILIEPDNIAEHPKATVTLDSLLAACVFSLQSEHVIWHNPLKGGSSSPRAAHFQAVPLINKEISSTTPLFPCCRLSFTNEIWCKNKTLRWEFLKPNIYPVRGAVIWGPVESVAERVWHIIDKYDKAQACNLIIEPGSEETEAIRVFVFPRRREKHNHSITNSMLKENEKMLLRNNRGGELGEWAFAGVETGLLTQVEWYPVFDEFNTNPKHWGNTLYRLLLKLTLEDTSADWHDFQSICSGLERQLTSNRQTLTRV